MNKDRMEILIGGIGGQGVVYSANLIARTALIRHKFASSIAHYGPESRGSVTVSEVVISDLPGAQQADYPVVESPDVFIAMHQKAYGDYAAKHKMTPKYLIYDSTLVNIGSEFPARPAGGRIPDSQVIGVPASQIARDKLSNIMMANIILTAVFAGTIGIITGNDLRRALKEFVSAQDWPLNQSALKLGFALK